MKFNINNGDEFRGTLEAGYHVVCGTRHNQCVIPSIDGFFKLVKNKEEQTLLAYVTIDDQVENSEYRNRDVFTNVAMGGHIYDDMMIRLFDANNLQEFYKAIDTERINLFSLLNTVSAPPIV